MRWLHELLYESLKPFIRFPTLTLNLLIQKDKVKGDSFLTKTSGIKTPITVQTPIKMRYMNSTPG